MKILKYITIFIFSACLPSLLTAQPGFAQETWEGNLEKAEQLMAEGSYYNAVTYYQKALSLKRDIETIYNTAEAYRLGRAYADASKLYAEVIQKGTDLNKSYPLVNYHYGSVLMQSGDYIKAKEALDNFNREYDGSKGNDYKRLAEAMIKGCELAGNNPTTVVKVKKAEALPKGINSRYTELSPMPYDNDKLLFSSISSNEYVAIAGQKKYAKMYTASVQKSGLVGEKENFDRAFSAQGSHVGNGAFSPKGDRLYYTICDQKISDNRVGCKIYVSTKNDAQWGKGELLNEMINLEGYESSTPFVAKGKNGEEILYFTSNRPGGYGQMDLWASTRTASGSFSAPVNLGASINTAGIETSPFVANSNEETLYFSSNGHPGYGGQDVFRARKSGSNMTAWERAENVGNELNTSADEMYFTINPSNPAQAFFVSNRAGTQSIESNTCCDDIFVAEIEADVKISVSANGIVYDQNGKLLEGSKVDLFDITDGQRKLIGSLTVAADGKYNFPDLAPEKQYAIEVNKTGYDPQRHEFSTAGLKESKNLQKDFYLKKLAPPPPPKPTGLVLKGTTYSDDGKNKAPLSGVKVDIYQIDPTTGRETLYVSTTSGANGEYSTTIPLGYKYKVIGSEPRHLNASDMLDLTNYVTPASGEIRKDLDLYLKLKQVGLTFTLENIYYDFDKATLRSESVETLQKLLTLLNDNPTIIVEMGSHTDNHGKNAYNDELSQRRAQSVVDWLIGKGVSKDRLKAKGYGESKPVAPNAINGKDNPEGRQKNRRTEFKLLGEVTNIRN